MPSRSPDAHDPLVLQELQALGDAVRRRRKSMRVAAGSVARAANLSRQTLHRIEQGEPSVTMGAWLNVLRALGLGLQVAGTPQAASPPEDAGSVRLADYPQLQRLAWHRSGDTLTGEEALALYERNWRHVDPGALQPAERDLIARLVARHGKGALLA
jgi:transcriptional regulator with XRE-family HTH domain